MAILVPAPSARMTKLKKKRSKKRFFSAFWQIICMIKQSPIGLGLKNRERESVHGSESPIRIVKIPGWLSNHQSFINTHW